MLKDRIVLKEVEIKQRDQVCPICRWSHPLIISASTEANRIFVKNTKAKTVLFERGFNGDFSARKNTMKEEIN